MARNSDRHASVHRVEERPWIDPREGHWPMPLYAAGVSLASTYYMAPIFGSSIRAQALKVVAAAASSFTLAALNWGIRIKHQPGVGGYWLSNPKADIAKGTVNAFMSCGVLPAFLGGYAAGKMSREVRYTGREIFIYAGPIWRSFVKTKRGFVAIGGASVLGFVLLRSYVNHHCALMEQSWEDLRKSAPKKETFKATGDEQN